MRLADVVRILDAKPLLRGYDAELQVVFGAAADLMSDVLSFARPGAVLLTGLTNPQVVRTADVAAVTAIVFVRGKIPPAETIELAEEVNIPLFWTSLTMFDACGRLYEAGLRHHFVESGKGLARCDSEIIG